MSPRPDRGSRLPWMLLALAGLVWGVYWSSLDNPFEFDDWHVITQNPSIRDLGNVPSFFSDVSHFSILTTNRDYRPVFLTSMALCWWVRDGSTRPFHVVSVALHMANAMLLFLVFRRVASRASDPAGGLAGEDVDPAAFLAAALFAVHPLATEPINYVSSQSIPLTAFFYLASFYAFLSVYGWPQRPAGAGKATRCLASWAAYALALLTKPIAITLPLVLLLWELLFGGPWRRPDAGADPLRVRAWRRLAKHLPYASITIGYLLIRGAVLPSAVGNAAFKASPDALLTHFLTQTRALVFYYLKRSVLPADLNADQRFPASTSIFEPRVLVALAVLAGLGLLLWRFRRHRALVFWALWFPACLLVTTYLVRLGQPVREGRAYLALGGVCAVVALLVFKLGRALPAGIPGLRVGRRSGRLLSTAAMAIVLVAFALQTRAQNRVWSSSLTLWRQAALHGGTWRAHMNYGLALDQGGQEEEALAELERAVELGANAYSHVNLGVAYVKRGRLEEGLSHLQRAVDLWPSLPEARLALAHGLEQSGRIDEAERELREALRLRPDYLAGLRRAADFHQRHDRPAEALASFRRLLELDPGQGWVAERIRALERRSSPDALFAEAFAAWRRGNRDRAVELYEQLLAVAPDHRQGNFNLGWEYLAGSSEADWRRSAELFRKVVEIDPDYSEAVHHLASAYWKLGQKAEAVHWDRLFVARPDAHPELKRTSLARLEREGG